MPEREGDREIRRAFERGFLQTDDPSPYLDFRYRVWCEARSQPYVSLVQNSESARVELDLSRGPCQLTPEDLEELRELTGTSMALASQTRCLAEVPLPESERVATAFFEVAWRRARSLEEETR